MQKSSYSLSTAKIDYYFVLLNGLSEEIGDSMLDCSHAQPITPVDEWAPPLAPGNERLEEVWLVAVI